MGPPVPPPPPLVTEATVSLSTPHDDDGAIVLSVRGPDLTTFKAASPSYVLYSRVASAQEARLIVIGDIGAGPLLTIQLATAHELSAYAVSVETVAMRSDSLRADLTGYDARLTGSSP